MAREIGKLKALFVKRVTTPGHYSDGGGLYIQVGAGAAKSWVFRWRDAAQHGGKQREMGLGPFHTVSLADARELARECRRQRLAGLDPIEQRRAARAAARPEATTAMAFRECALAYVEAHKATWSNRDHEAQWNRTLRDYAFPVLGNMPVAAIDTGLVMQVLQPIWATKTETASRLRGRIERILDWAKVQGYRDGENPARWRGHLSHLLANRARLAPTKHHAALPWQEAPAFMSKLSRQTGVSALALQCMILTACRTAEVLGARWGEIDLDNRVWVIPASRMKAKREHRVPLSQPVLDLLRSLREAHTGDYVFPGQTAGRPLSHGAMRETLGRMGRSDVTAHGFRSTFRDWAGETGHADDIAEAALAHIAGDKTVVAYARGDRLDRRRALMDAWAAYLATTDAVSPERIAAE